MHSRRLIAPCLLLTASLLSACAGERATLPSLASDAVILAFGDSLTHGTGAARGASYPAILASLTAREIVNAGIPGEVSAAGLARLPRVLEEVELALMILCHGGNDLLKKRGLDQAKANIRRMIDLARARGVQVLLVGVPAPGLWLDIAPLCEELAQELLIPIEADALPDILSQAALKADPAHLNAAGYAEFAQRLHARLRELGAL